ncbi:hypothetical protein [Afifella pfennigii]|uniref:hypothetical protein n=1 Tax=Afifella pfennigii TaxID=209897 RepID=UPI00047E7911|nr:hypothetical protein [Afifella pfennigii]
MSLLRRLLRDRLAGGLLPAILAYTLCFQAMVVVVADAAMAAGGAAPGLVLCQPSNAAQEAPNRRGEHACCDALCQAVCGLGAALACASGGEPGFRSSHHIVPGLAATNGIHPASLGLAGAARAPPLFLS